MNWNKLFWINGLVVLGGLLALVALKIATFYFPILLQPLI